GGGGARHGQGGAVAVGVIGIRGVVGAVAIDVDQAPGVVVVVIPDHSAGGGGFCFLGDPPTAIAHVAAREQTGAATAERRRLGLAEIVVGDDAADAVKGRALKLPGRR